MVKEYWFDMDHTLINNDCDVSWKEFLVKHGYAPLSALDTAAAFFDDYNRGEMDGDAFTRFQLEEFKGRTHREMEPLVRQHFEEFVRPRIYCKAKKFIDSLVDFTTGILTATNTVIAAPVAEYFGVRHLLGTTLEVDQDGRYTGWYVPPFAAGRGKVEALKNHIAGSATTLEDVAYYGDSINDRHILEAVGVAVAANPSADLAALARKSNWSILSFK